MVTLISKKIIIDKFQHFVFQLALLLGMTSSFTSMENTVYAKSFSFNLQHVGKNLGTLPGGLRIILHWQLIFFLILWQLFVCMLIVPHTLVKKFNVIPQRKQTLAIGLYFAYLISLLFFLL